MSVAHYCYKIDQNTNQGQTQAWLDKGEASALLTQMAEGSDCEDEAAAATAWIASQPDGWRLLLNGLLAGGTEGTERTPDHFGYSLDELGPLFGCLFGPPPQA